MNTLLTIQAWLYLLVQQQLDDSNPFKKVTKFINDDIIGGFTSIAAPIATLAFIGLAIAAMMSTDEHQRQKFKSGLWWTGIAAVVCFSASSIVKWLDKAFD